MNKQKIRQLAQKERLRDAFQTGRLQLNQTQVWLTVWGFKPIKKSMWRP